ncbi:MAG: ComEC/Rec2 family competence protein [bacterium]|nr:ComEC/Rec2 family competence protein [bacterium]
MTVRPDRLFFFAACGFVIGTILGGLGASPVVAIFIVIFFVLFFFKKISSVIILTISGFFLVGNIYYAIDDYAYQMALQGVENVTYFEGVVIDEPRHSLEAQTAKVELTNADVESALGGRVYVRTDLYPELSYGDVVRVSGDIVPPPRDSYGRYMAKERMHGTVFYPEIERIGNDGNALLRSLFGVRRHIKNQINILFTQQHAAFLSGILLGDKDEFSPEFLKKLSQSGTMHLMALSGLNMTIIVFIALGVFSVIFRGRKRLQFIMTFGTVALFVAMTSFQVSALRAALMAFLVGLAGVAHRLYRPHHAIACAALIITAWNPKAPVFDLGFQLSFLATLAIIYFAPVLKLLPFLRTNGVLGWRDALAITLAAELGVAPLTIINFGNFSFTALFANIGILAVIPLLTVLGFLIVLFGLLFPPLAFLISQLAAFLIDYVIAVVETFAILYAPFNPEIGAIIAVLYYCVVIGICWYWSPIRRTHEKSS